MPKTLAGIESNPVAPTEPRECRPVDAPPARLVVIRHGQLVREFPLQGSRWLIGRWDPQRRVFPDVDLDNEDPEATVSRQHACLTYQNGQYFIEDLGSTNGTFINRGHRLIPGRRYLVEDGDEIIVGKTFLKLVIG
ncbi:MAG: FHA domain-containing protein [Acidobacteriota bacterium]|nr:FHA domain-containing protein [Blastocatellia bacterium]MDW8238699.1 FHA domain-containing protein [Acidobacteriota bacterium]